MLYEYVRVWPYRLEYSLVLYSFNIKCVDELVVLVSHTCDSCIIGIPTTFVYPQSTPCGRVAPPSHLLLVRASFTRVERVVRPRFHALSRVQRAHRPRVLRVSLRVSEPLHLESLVLINYVVKTTTI
jgi:hypothetical protein